jgi:hypothetical protein
MAEPAHHVLEAGALGEVVAGVAQVVEVQPDLRVDGSLGGRRQP